MLGKRRLKHIYFVVVVLVMLSPLFVVAQFFPTGHALAPVVKDDLDFPLFDDDGGDLVDDTEIMRPRRLSDAERRQRKDALDVTTKQAIDDAQTKNIRTTRIETAFQHNVRTIADTTQRAKERQQAAEEHKKEYEDVLHGFITQHDDIALDRLPFPDYQQIKSPLNLMMSTVVSDVMRVGNVIGITPLYLPNLNAVQPYPYDLEAQCGTTRCRIYLHVENYYPSLGGGSSGSPYSYVKVSLFAPQTRWSLGWGNFFDVFVVNEVSPGVLEVQFPESLLHHVQSIRLKVVNHVNGNMYLSNTLTVPVVGVPDDPSISSLSYSTKGKTTYLVIKGENFYPQKNVNVPGPYYGMLFSGTMQGGVFGNGNYLNYEYVNSKKVNVNIDDFSQIPPFHVIMTNVNKNKYGLYTLSTPQLVPALPPIQTSPIDDDVEGFSPFGLLDNEHCSNKVDDDGDGLADCEDPECDTNPVCTSGSPGFIASYAFDEGSGTTVSDASGNGYTGTLFGPSWSTSCLSGSCLSFDGSNDYVDVPDAPLLNPVDELTLATWLRYSSDGVLISKGATGNQYQLRIVNNKLKFVINGVVGPEIPYTFSPNTWYHVAGTYDGDQMQLYVNGIAVGSSVVTSVPIQGTDGVGLQIGRRVTLNNFGGVMDDIMVLDYGLSATEVANLAFTSSVEVCDNGFDDDGDGKTDCEDSDCDGQVGGPFGEICEFGTELTCNDFFDNDADGPYDCSDQDCLGTSSCQVTGGEVCDNGVDDDGDGLEDCLDVLDCCSDPFCSAHPSCTVAAGDHVATIGVIAPQLSQFTLHATIPVPPGTYTQNDHSSGHSPFGVVNTDGTVVPAQTVGVSRYPNGDYDVVEVIARVDRGSVNVGSYTTYDVVIFPHGGVSWPGSGTTVKQAVASGPANVPQSIKNLVNSPLKVRAWDPSGVKYETDITLQSYGNQKVFRYGDRAVQVRTHNTLMPVSGGGDYDHLMGVHAYFTARAQEPVLQIDLRLHNGASGIQPTSPENSVIQELYFDKFEILVPTGYALDYLFDHPSRGGNYQEGPYRVYEIIDSLPGNRLEVMRTRSHTDRRLALYPTGSTYQNNARSVLDHEGLGFSVNGQSSTPGFGERWSWHNPLTSNYFPQSVALPTVNYLGVNNVRSWYSSAFNEYKFSYGSGNNNGFYKNGVNGIWTQAGDYYGGTTGGSHIWMTDGHGFVMSASAKGYLRQIIQHRTMNDRQATYFFTGDGEALEYEDAMENIPQGNIVPVRFFNDFDISYNCPGSSYSNKCDPFGYRLYNNQINSTVWNSGRQPSYIHNYYRFTPIDGQHLIRNTRTSMALVWAGNDALAKDDLKMSGEIAHFAHATLPMGYSGSNKVWNPSGSLVGSSSGTGLTFGRGNIHPTQVFTAAYAVEKDDQWRNRKKQDWFDYLINNKLIPSQIQCTGLINWYINKETNSEYRAGSERDNGMLDNALQGVMYRVMKGEGAIQENNMRAMMNKHLDLTVLDIYDPTNPYVWKQNSIPRQNIIVSDVKKPNTLSNIYCNWVSIPPSGQAWGNKKTASFEPKYTLAYGIMDTGLPKFHLAAYNLAGALGGSGTTLVARMQNLVNNPGKLESAGNSEVVLLACAQEGTCKYP